MGVTPEQKSLIAQAEDLRGNLSAIVAKGENATAEELAKAIEYSDAITEIKGRIQSIRELSEKAQEYDAWLNVPETNAGVHPGGATLLGDGRASGGATVGRGADGKSALFSLDGECLISEKELQVRKDPAYKAAYMQYIRSGGRVESKALAEGSDASGGYWVPEEMLERIIEKKPTPTRLGDLVQSLPTSRDALTIPKVKYTTDDLYSTGIRVIAAGEVPANSTAVNVNFPDTTGNNQFAAERFQVYTQMMAQPVSNDMLEDALFPVNSWMADKFRETILLYKDNMILNGLGVNQPTGILLNPGGANQPAVVAMGNPITGDGALSVSLSLPEQYEEGARYIFNKTSTYKTLRLLKDGNSRYLFGEGYQDSGMAPGRAKELGGYPYIFSGFAPNVGANAYPILFGDPSGYIWVDRVGVSIQVLREISALTNQTVILARFRVGGGLAEDWKFKIGQQA